MNSHRRKKRGFILYTAVVIAFLTMLWAVAAVHRVNNQTGATLHSYRKSEAYYLAKQAASRSLAFMNADPSWLDIHTDQASADVTTPGTHAWVEKEPSKITLVVEADISGQKRTIKIPILDDSDESSKLFSLSPSLNSGPDVISWATTRQGDWQGLPPIPGAATITATATSKSGDVFACTGEQPTSMLWRYRTGQGWMQMPDLPPNVELTQLSCSGDARLVGKGSDNTILKLPLGTSSGQSMVWESIRAPSNNTIKVVEADPGGSDNTIITSVDSSAGDPRIFVHNGSTWIPQSIPSNVSNLDGGLTIDSDGSVYVASNGQPAATIYRRDANAAGVSPTEWQPIRTTTRPGLPAPPAGSVPAIEWVGTSAQNPSGFIQNIISIEADPGDNSLWVQWNNPSGSNSHNLVQVPTQ